MFGMHEMHGLTRHPDKALVCQKYRAAFPVRGGKIFLTRHPRMRQLRRWLRNVSRSCWAPSTTWWLIWWRQFIPSMRVRSSLNTSIQQKHVRRGTRRTMCPSRYITLDLFDYETVDIVCSMEALPFAANSVDGFVSLAVIEHLPDPFAVVESLYRASRPGGVGIHDVPFMYHLSQSSARLHTLHPYGIDESVQEMEDGAHIQHRSPVSLMLSSGIEIVTFGNGQIKELLYLALCCVTFPIKFLDWPFVDKHAVFSYAPGLCIVVQKDV